MNAVARDATSDCHMNMRRVAQNCASHIDRAFIDRSTHDSEPTSSSRKALSLKAAAEARPSRSSVATAAFMASGG